MNSTQRRDGLKAGDKLHGYQIEQVLGSGSFGITYLAEHSMLGSWHVIKEYLPDNAFREPDNSVQPKSEKDRPLFEWGLKNFFDEARLLHGLSHPGVVKVTDLFEGNGTAYFVMPYLKGQTFYSWLRRNPGPSRASLENLFIPILDGLKYIHERDLLHRDIKPENIYILEDGHPVLIDFGAARQAIGHKSRTLTQVLTPHFAPVEQYASKGPFTPALDLYSLAACIYQAVTGCMPEEAPGRVLEDTQPLLTEDGELVRQYGRNFMAAVDKALAVRAEDRCQSALEFQKALLGFEARPAEAIPDPRGMVINPGGDDPAEDGYEPPRLSSSVETRRRLRSASGPAGLKKAGGCFLMIVGAMVVMLVLLAGIYFWLNTEEESPPPVMAEETKKTVTTPAADETVAVPPAPEPTEETPAEPEEEKSSEAVWLAELADIFVERRSSGLALAEAERLYWQGNLLAGLYLEYRNLNENFHYTPESEKWATRNRGNKVMEILASMPDEPYARVMEGLVYDMGLAGVRNASDRALESLWPAAESGDPLAQHLLGQRYYIGLGVPEDPAAAFRWFRSAADQGYAPAQNQMGILYGEGEAVERDQAEAARWYLAAAESGLREAQYNLGLAYLYGEGLPQNDAEAEKWLKAAADQGESEAAAILELLREGRRPPASDESAAGEAKGSRRGSGVTWGRK